MPRGRLLRTKKRDAYWQGKMEERGKQQALLEAHKHKPLEESAKEHLGKILDNIDKPTEVALDAALAYMGYQVFGNWKGALWGPISLRLARARNEAAGISGIAGLVSLGVATAIIDIPGFYKAMENFFIGYPIKMNLNDFFKAPAEQVPQRERWLFERFAHLTTSDYCQWYLEKYPEAQEPIWCIVQRTPKPPEKPPEDIKPPSKPPIMIVNPEWTKWLDDNPGRYIIENPYPHYIEKP